MTAFNVVRFKVKPGMEDAFLAAHRSLAWPGLSHANMIRTGEGRYCLIAQWESTEALAAGRPQMIATLNSFRETLEDLGGGLGVTDAVSGPVVLAIR
jgi:quinol monooxygenase YgiN